MLPALLVTLGALKEDRALSTGNRGARKLIVTTLYDQKEKQASEAIWKSPLGSEKCPVLVMEKMEAAVFNQQASQDCHYHKEGTEIYMVIEGNMLIAVEGTDYVLSEGDMIVVNPEAVHQVKPEGTEFICRVITVNCGGASDKYVC
ncbi:cupin domain-containing protein [Candidatus Poribacteria bacterium]|nr:cupin domain-containing protein [Candidatus Poribacteria bacterium]